ncbi:MAG: pyridoxal-phosphate dependent enzyme [Solirubrobacteraceae bacterium]
MPPERLVRNPLAGPVERVAGAPLDFHRSLPGYAPTPLVESPAAARALGVERVLVKDESSRLGLPSFKVLGASWATYRALGRTGSPAELREALGGRPALACATDGNHGRAVAWMARLLGLPARVLVPAAMVPARREAIAGEGAQVEVVDGTYDDAVDAAAALAGDGTLVIQDTGEGPVPAWVIDGYATIGAEIDAEPDIVAVQIGVGSFAAAMVRRFAGTRIVGVEPVAAACALASAEAGRPVEVPGPHDSAMAGLNCGRVSPVAWPVISRGIEAFATVGDDCAREAVALLARDGISAGDSGAAGLAGLLALRDELDVGGTVLVVNTEHRTSGTVPKLRRRSNSEGTERDSP